MYCYSWRPCSIAWNGFDGPCTFRAQSAQETWALPLSCSACSAEYHHKCCPSPEALHRSSPPCKSRHKRQCSATLGWAGRWKWGSLRFHDQTQYPTHIRHEPWNLTHISGPCGSEFYYINCMLPAIIEPKTSHTQVLYKATSPILIKVDRRYSSTSWVYLMCRRPEFNLCHHVVP